MKYRPGPEKSIQTEVLNYLWAIGVFAWNAKAIPLKKRKNNIKSGVSDIVGIIPNDGRILCIELKSKTGRVSPEQKIFLERIARDGGIAGVARSLQDVIEILGSACGVQK